MSIFKRLAQQQLIVPYIENAINRDTWPDKYTVTVDSRPYYGLTDSDGVTHEVGSGDGYFHPSTHPLMPARELYYRFHPEHAPKIVTKKWSMAALMSVAVGTAMHAVIQTQLDMCKLLVRGSEEWHEHGNGVLARYPENNLGEWEYIREATKTRGRMDGIIDHPLEGIIGFEYKTMNARLYRQLEQESDAWSVQTQLGADHYGLDKVVILVQEMGYPWDMKELVVVPRKARLEPIYEKFEYVQECIKRDTPPPCEHPLGSEFARVCPVNDLCWSL